MQADLSKIRSSDCQFSVRTWVFLKARFGDPTLAELHAIPDANFLEILDFGRQSLSEIRTVISLHLNPPDAAAMGIYEAALVASYQARIAELEAEVAELRAQITEQANKARLP
jgi:cell shape-determining protein MreC